MSKCKTCEAKRKLSWDNDFCTLECKAAWLEAEVKRLEATVDYYVRKEIHMKGTGN
jgi:hypothetical protein